VKEIGSIDTIVTGVPVASEWLVNGVAEEERKHDRDFRTGSATCSGPHRRPTAAAAVHVTSGRSHLAAHSWEE
jgi:isopropylmalate/homocitrate/citramalate synthase